jgi:YVTN family beta-propeller protein
MEIPLQISRCSTQWARSKTVSSFRLVLQSLVLAIAATCASSAARTQAPAPPLTLSKTIALPGVNGKFDHFAVDLSGHRLFAAATGNHSVEVIDLSTNKVEQSIAGLGKPHGLAWVASTGSLYVADGTLAELRVYKGAPLALAGAIKLSDDADDMVYDGATQTLFVGHGGGDAANPAEIAVIDTAKFALVANLPVASHPEALDLDAAGQRVFANIADSNEIAVVSTATRQIVDRWKLSSAGHNVPLAFDGSAGVLYVACRKPPVLVAVVARTGKETASAPSAEGADDLFLDESLHRLYLISGAGEVDAYSADAHGKLGASGVINTAPGAKTALFVPSLHALYVGIPGTADHAAEIRVYATSSAQVPQ